MAKRSDRGGREGDPVKGNRARSGRKRDAAGSAASEDRGATWQPQEKVLRNSRRRSTKASDYLRPVATPAVAPKLAAGLGAGGVAIRCIEITQAIQGFDNSVLLVADKPTAVRVHVDPDGFSAATTLTGELTWQRGAGGASYLPALNRVFLGGSARPDLTEQRFNLKFSLNFLLPPEALASGELELRLSRLQVPGGAEVPFVPPPVIRVRFVPTPPLRIRAIGFRYRSLVSPGSHVTPSSIHFSYLKSYLERAYPVAKVEWSQIVVDGDQLVPPFGQPTSNLVNAQLAAIRSRELSTGTDPRTHYFGLVDTENGQNFMRGSALYNAVTKVFGMVACGPCGVPNGWVGDTDASFADWYGAHELGHTFQRRHPGFPVEDQQKDPDEPGFPYPEGLISGPDHKYVGFDIGDPMLGLPMMVLPGNKHHDVMTYAASQWLSAYTYEAVHARLLVEDQQLAPMA